jgi:hypothetical protein
VTGPARAGVSVFTISRLERGQCPATIPAVQRLAAALGVAMWRHGGAGRPPPAQIAERPPGAMGAPFAGGAVSLVPPIT